MEESVKYPAKQYRGDALAYAVYSGLVLVVAASALAIYAGVPTMLVIFSGVVIGGTVIFIVIPHIIARWFDTDVDQVFTYAE